MTGFKLFPLPYSILTFKSWLTALVRESGLDRVCLCVCLIVCVCFVPLVWMSMWACAVTSRASGSVPCKVVILMMGSRPWKVLLRDVSSLNMHFEWSAALSTLFTEVGVNQMLISLVNINAASDSTSCNRRKVFRLTYRLRVFNQTLALISKMLTATQYYKYLERGAIWQQHYAHMA